MTNKLGFKQDDLSIIVQIISTFPGIKKAVIFGSRAKGNYKAGSDIDIAVCAINNDSILQLSGVLNDETLLPYKFDLLNYDTINNKELKEHIDRAGIEIYKQ
ncbi:nucleotidyltransferase family protein [Mucilaginibacter sp.]|uniref:nucleotidyltransferase family protein n=1 Tax=Mucilaginibacter sp. TaxID=1882438 RepID=UPI00260B6EEA|nr:nucleotidyltransferase domain-containing protein [Mucilaginibacter sp.]MDB4925475.1 polymerase beta domain protein region [Mucilaginibacter sp.]